MLYVLIGVVVALLLLVFATQVVIPAFTETRLFPSFRSTPLAEEVAATREQVMDMQEQNESLEELEVLLTQREELEKKIAEKQHVVNPKE